LRGREAGGEGSRRGEMLEERMGRNMKGEIRHECRQEDES